MKKPSHQNTVSSILHIKSLLRYDIGENNREMTPFLAPRGIDIDNHAHDKCIH